MEPVCLPECKGKSLEEVNLLFYHKVPAWKSSKWTPPIEADKDLEAFARDNGNAKPDIDEIEPSRLVEDVRDVYDEDDIKGHSEKASKHSSS